MNDNVNVNPILNDYFREYASVFYLLTDEEYIILDTNEFSQTILGFDPIGKTIHDTFLDFSMTLGEDIVNRKPDKEILLNVRTFTGIPQTLYITFQPVGDRILFLGRFDVMEIERLRQELVHLNNDMSNLTRELHKKNAELIKLNKLKNQFLGMAAHDLRKPAGIVQMFTEFLIEEAGDKLSDEHREFLDYIYTSSVSMLHIVNDFLDASLIESGEFNLEWEILDVVEVVRKHVHFHNTLSKKRNIRIQLEHETGLPETHIDKAKIEQVLNNILFNAVEYSPDNSCIIVTLRRDDNVLVVSIRDQGPGIPEEVLKNLFRPFGKGTQQKKGGVKSIGIGLSISKKIIDAHGGNIRAESPDGGGAVFSFTLPINIDPGEN